MHIAMLEEDISNGGVITIRKNTCKRKNQMFTTVNLFLCGWEFFVYCISLIRKKSQSLYYMVLMQDAPPHCHHTVLLCADISWQ